MGGGIQEGGLTIADYALWFECKDMLIIDSFTTNEYDEVDSITFEHGETLP